MILQGFYVGKRAWYVMCYYDIRTRHNLEEVGATLLSAGADRSSIDEAMDVLSEPNCGYTYSSFGLKTSAIFISHTTTPEQMYDTIQHELKHVVEHISEYYGIDCRSEKAAYLQGEIARQMFSAAALAVCPKCNKQESGDFRHR